MSKERSPDLAGLVHAPPGADLVALLDGLDLATVPGSQLVDVLLASWREVSHAYAGFLAAVAEIGRFVRTGAGDRGGECEWAGSEIGAALTFTARRAQTELDFARQLCGRLPRVWQALRDGRIDVHKARVFADYLPDCTDQQITRILDRLLPQAPRLTTGQLAARLLREVQAVDAGCARRRYERAAQDRGVWGYLAADGTAVLSAHGLSPSEAAGAAERLECLAEMVRMAGHPGTANQLRADLFVRLLDGRYTGFDQQQIVAAMLAEVTGDSVPAGPPTGAEEGTSGADSTVGEATSPSSGDATASPCAATGAAECSARADSATAGGSRVADADESAAGTIGVDLLPSSPVVEPAHIERPDGATGDLGPVIDALGVDAAVGCASAEPEAANRDVEPGEADLCTDPRDPGTDASIEADGADPPPAPSTSAAAVPAETARCGVEVRVGLATLLGLDDHPGEIPGWGPIPADDARLLVDRQLTAEWRYAITDQRGYLRHAGLTRRRPRHGGDRPTCRGGIVEIYVPTGLLAELARCPDLPHEWAGIIEDLHDQLSRSLHSTLGLEDRPRARRPGAGLRRHIQMRDRTCVAPGCRRPACACDLDHTVDFQSGGPTIRANMEPLCARHHAMKHHGGWQLEQPYPGFFRWRSPLGQVYWTRGEPIAPDLPEPLDRAPEDDPDRGSDAGPEARPALRISTPPPPGPRRRPPPRPTEERADEPPF